MNQDKANSARAHLVHRHMQRRFEKHRDRLEKHKLKGPLFARAVEELERKLFGQGVPPPLSGDTPEAR